MGHDGVLRRRPPDLPVGEPTDFAGKMALTGLPSDQEIFYRVTADVHYTAAHRYSPERATFQHFDPFWEVVSGPLHAEAFGSSEYDPTFGPEVVFAKHPTEEQGLNCRPRWAFSSSARSTSRRRRG
jgi:phosphodiesterase/alkaline phosphatase D-like protein